MKYIVIGLGYFGSKLASNLTTMGHEVIGVDHHYERIDELKESVTTVIKLDGTNKDSVRSLPLKDADAVIVAIGEDVGASILTASILKNLGVKRIIGRAINQVHHNILNQIGIDEVVLPLEDSAMHVASLLQFKNTLRLIELSEDHAVAEIVVPLKYAGHAPDTVNISERFSLKLIGVKKAPEDSILSSILRRNFKVDLNPDQFSPLSEKDVLIVAGKIIDIKRFTES